MASSAQSRSSSPSVVVVVMLVKVEFLVVVIGLVVCAAAGTAIWMPESPVQGDAKRLRRGGQEDGSSSWYPGEEEEGLLL